MWRFLAHLKERKIAHWGVAYLAGAWLLLQVLDLLAQPFAWPALVLRAATVLAGIGFFAALVIAWYHGEKGAQKVSGVELLMLTGILAIAAAAVAFVGGGPRHRPLPAAPVAAVRTEDARRVLVLPFENGTGEAELGPLGSIVADWITEALLRSGFVEVVDLQTALLIGTDARDGTSPRASPERMAALAEASRAGTLVVGRYYRDGEQLLFSARIARADGTVIEALPAVRGPLASPTVGVEALRERVISALATHHDARLRDLEGGGAPPTFAAYEAYVEGIGHYFDNVTVEAAADFDRALALDSTFLRAAIWSLASNLLSRKVDRADAAVAHLERNSRMLAPYDLHHFRFFQAAMAGDHPRAYAEARAMMAAAPGSDEAVREAALSALRARRPQEALVLLGRLDFSRGPLAGFKEYWTYRTSMQLAAGDTGAARLTALEALRRLPGNPIALRAMARVHGATGNGAAAEAYVDSILLQQPPRVNNSLLATHTVALTLPHTGAPAAGRRVLQQLLAWIERHGDAPPGAGLGGLRAEVLYLLGDTARARTAASAVMPYRETLSYLPAVTVLAALAARGGDTIEANRLLRDIESVRYSPDLVSHRQSQARIHALLGHVDRAAEIASTAAFNELHPDFDRVRHSAAFRAAIRPK